MYSQLQSLRSSARQELLSCEDNPQARFSANPHPPNSTSTGARRPRKKSTIKLINSLRASPLPHLHCFCPLVWADGDVELDGPVQQHAQQAQEPLRRSILGKECEAGEGRPHRQSQGHACRLNKWHPNVVTSFYHGHKYLGLFLHCTVNCPPSTAPSNRSVPSASTTQEIRPAHPHLQGCAVKLQQHRRRAQLALLPQVGHQRRQHTALGEGLPRLQQQQSRAICAIPKQAQHAVTPCAWLCEQPRTLIMPLMMEGAGQRWPGEGGPLKASGT